MSGAGVQSGDSVTVLGINAGHDASACVTVDGELVVALAEERLCRRKHVTGPPHRAIDHCLREAGLDSIEAVDCAVVSEQFYTDFGEDLRREGFRGELFINPSHHMLHAYYAAAASGQTEAAILIVDGSGYTYAEHNRRGSPLLGPPPTFEDMNEAETSFALKDGKLELVERRWALWEARAPYLRFPSLGHMCSVASQYIFGRWVHAGKTMGLAPYGNPTRFEEPIVTCGDAGIAVDTEWILRLPPRSDKPAHLDDVCRDVAAKVQLELERGLLFLARRLFDASGIPYMCFSGGVALNSVANARLRSEGPFTGIFVTPAAGDSGIAVGCAAYGHHHLTGELPRWPSYSDFLGPRYGAARTRTALGAVGDVVCASDPADPAADAAHEIARGRVVGWFEGRSELGPRALGHRSILCDPRGDSIRDHLNEWVKFREPFRPYAASVLEEHATTYFELDWSDRFMLSVVRIRPGHRHLLPSICHVDESCRIQMVPVGAGAYRRLIEAFFQVTGLPVVLNTSLNVRGEPIVETPADALRCFVATNIDLIYLDGQRVEKAVLDPAAVVGELIPRPNDGIAVDDPFGWKAFRWSPLGPRVSTRTGHRIPISEIEAEVLRRVDGRTTVGELTAGSPPGREGEVVAALARLQRRGLISMAVPPTGATLRSPVK